MLIWYVIDTKMVPSCVEDVLVLYKGRGSEERGVLWGVVVFPLELSQAVSIWRTATTRRPYSAYETEGRGEVEGHWKHLFTFLQKGDKYTTRASKVHWDNTQLSPAKFTEKIHKQNTVPTKDKTVLKASYFFWQKLKQPGKKKQSRNKQPWWFVSDLNTAGHNHSIRSL